VRALALRQPSALAAFLAFVVGPLAVFAALGDEARENDPYAWDFDLLWFVHGYDSRTLDAATMFFSLVGGGAGLLAILVPALIALRRRLQPVQIYFLLAALLGTTVVTSLLKLAFQKPRPDLWTSPWPAHGYSFPSGHATESMAVFAALVVLLWPTRWRWPALLMGVPLVATVGLSRVYLGVHYPSDVLAGWCFALAWVAGLWFLLARRLRTAF
jgi:membrane-associated phospholipid phosphatase